MQILAISLATEKTVEYRGKPVRTGIYKIPVTGPVMVTATGIAGDVQVDLENHGGADKAVYVYSAVNYRWWEGELSRPLANGLFGENLTVSGLTDDEVHIGDTFRIGPIEAQVTQPRVPCYKLGIVMSDPGFVARFHHSGRVGFYLRILREGQVGVGDPIERVGVDPVGLSIRDAMLALGQHPRQQEIIEQALSIPALSQSWRHSLEKRRKR
ncbi:MOSC domain-containing protein [Methylococcus sp. EFPC2]|uniref:MOSC domain-containing protein n=1 Tax=Methylococcus sp. EFPC2 TaxID=2812648 RepID=UPI001967CB6B|nr:MOSC domain-containing protein [Methylococcus sp. EFPC2]QSA95721.1 MOSC domain-containing protein [Methylococcus sp. EFPC2]